jgi:hypothetical protein
MYTTKEKKYTFGLQLGLHHVMPVALLPMLQEQSLIQFGPSIGAELINKK